MRESLRTVDQSRQRLETSLQSLRTQIYLSSILVRDYLLDTAASNSSDYRDRLQQNYARARAELETVVRLASTANPAQVRAMEAEVHAFWESVLRVLDLSPEQRRSAGYDYLREQVIRRRQAAVLLAEELGDMIEAETDATRRELDRAVADFRSRMLVVRAVALALAALIGGLCTWRVRRLEEAPAGEQLMREQAERDSRELARQVVSAQEEERRSLSRELHDEVGQMVTALKLRLSTLSAQAEPPSQEFERTMAECQGLVEQTVTSIRQLAMGLRPAMLDDLGMAAAIEWQAREFSRRFDIPVTVSVSPATDAIGEPHKTHLYRIVQEGLTNCARHARARSVQVKLEHTDQTMLLTITDDGVGFRSDGRRGRGFGLAGIAERVHELGGSFEMRSAEGKGTTLEITVPMAGGDIACTK